MAGLFPVTLIKEPEAAALYTIRSLDFCLNVGDAFVICDAGGGTVDLISYEVTAMTPNLKIRELVPGTGTYPALALWREGYPWGQRFTLIVGGMAGSLGLNQRFVEAVKTLVGKDQFHELQKTKGFFRAEKEFDRVIKKAFRGEPSEEYFVNFPMAALEDNPEAGLESNAWMMTE